jgi:glycerate 2-kinase
VRDLLFPGEAQAGHDTAGSRNLYNFLRMPEFPLDRERLVKSMRGIARQLFLHALAEANIEKAFAHNVHCERGILRVCEDLYDLSSYARVVVISIGKAGHTMVEALRDQVGESLEGIVASSMEPPGQVRGFRYFRGGHPTPSAESLRAAESILKSLSSQNAASLVVFMLSGGGSSMVEKPIDEEISLDDLTETYRVLVHSGAPIAEINAIRKHLSAVKGGRLAVAAHPAQQVSLLVSDVPDASLDALASGPTMPDSTSVEDCYAIAQKYNLLAPFPESVAELFRRHALEETPKSDDPAFQRSRWWPVLSNAAVVKNAVEEAKRLGFAVQVDNSCDDWDYERAAEYLVQRVRELRRESPRACLISGGEVTVKVVNGGVGGRNQQLALSIAARIAGESITALCAGTDGIDGNSPAAGAIADGSTADRVQGRGLDLAAALARFDAFPLFDALGDAIITGPTGNNLRDLRILLAY